jgi:hypothetical protein
LGLDAGIAGELSLKINKMISDKKPAAMCNTNSRNTNEFWRSVNNLRNTKGLTSVTDFGPPFNDLTHVDEFFASVATDSVDD